MIAGLDLSQNIEKDVKFLVHFIKPDSLIPKPDMVAKTKKQNKKAAGRKRQGETMRENQRQKNKESKGEREQVWRDREAEKGKGRIRKLYTNLILQNRAKFIKTVSVLKI